MSRGRANSVPFTTNRPRPLDAPGRSERLPKTQRFPVRQPAVTPYGLISWGFGLARLMENERTQFSGHKKVDFPLQPVKQWPDLATQTFGLCAQQDSKSSQDGEAATPGKNTPCLLINENDVGADFFCQSDRFRLTGIQAGKQLLDALLVAWREYSDKGIRLGVHGEQTGGRVAQLGTHRGR